MTDSEISVETGAAERAAPNARRRGVRALRWGIVALLAGPVLLVLAVAGLWLRLSIAPLTLPDLVTDEVEARIDVAMPANAFRLGEVTLALPRGTEPEITFRQMTLSDADGTIRAAFPEMQVALSAGALSRGELRPTRVDIAGAGLRMSRDAEGRLDLELTQEGGATLSLEETLERIDTMFAAADFVELQSVTGSGLSVAMVDDMTGQVMWVRGADMQLERKNGAITLLLGGALEGTRDAWLDLAITRNARLGRTDMGINFTNVAARDLATASPALGWLDLMRAPISGRLVARLQDSGAVGDMSGELRVGSGQFSITGVEAPLAFEAIAADFSYEAARSRIGFNLLEVVAPELSFAADGHADVSPDGDEFIGQFRLSGIEAAPRDLFPAPLLLDGAAIDLRLTLAPDLQVEIGQAVVFDGDRRAVLRGDITSNAAGLSVALDAHVVAIQSDAVLGYWPTGAIPRTRAWLEDNLHHGALSGVDFAFRSTPDAAPVFALDFDFEQAQLTALRHMPPIEDASGFLSLHGPQLRVQVDEGSLYLPEGGALSVDGSMFRIADTRPRGPDAEIDLELRGALGDVLTLLQRPPVNLFADGALTPARLGTGQAEVSARIATPLRPQLPYEAIDFQVEGVIREYQSDQLVPGRRLEAEALQVAVTPETVELSGRALFEGVPLTGRWARAIGPGAAPDSRLDGRVTLDRANLSRLGVDLPEWLLSGRASADLVLQMTADAAPELRLRSDLDGLRLAVPQLGWRKPASRAGALDIALRLGPAPQVTALNLQAAGLRLDGRVQLEDGAFRSLVADRLRIGSWLDVQGRLNARGPGAAPGIQVTGGVLDLRGLPQGGGSAPGGGGSAPVSVALDRLQVTDGIALTGLGAELMSDGGLFGQFRGRVNGGAEATGTLTTTEYGPAVRVRAEDGGHVLRSAGLLQTVHGGEMELIIAASGATGSYDGQLTIDGPRLRDAPAMAELLNLISVVGLLEQLVDEGINLGEVYGRFVITPEQIRLTRGNAIGPSMGLSMDGAYDVGARQFDMQGVISPLYAVNGIFGALFAPRREGLFGFSYRLTGTPEDTNVAVNPLSILTPGIFREIFRRPPPEPVEPE